jgi:hypothetical protein
LRNSQELLPTIGTAVVTAMATAANFESVLGVNQNTATSNARRGDTGGPNTSGHNSAEK